MRFVLLCLALAACGDNNNIPTVDAKVDSPMVDASDPNNPLTLFDTGLCVDRPCTQISPNVHAYTPQFALWADTATKRRWFQLPQGTQIDTSDMDHWQFPVGTKFWKEFSRSPDGVLPPVRVETRLVMRIGPGDTPNDWFYISYMWNAAQTDTTAVTMGQMDANGTPHDIPSRVQCKGCHENFKPTRILGFGAIQLDAPAVNAGETTLDTLIADQLLTVNPPGAATSPHYPLPSDANADQKAALGYLHANCSHCHNPTSSVHDVVPMELRLTVATVSGVKANTPTYLTAVNHNATNPLNSHTKIIDPGSPDTSIMIKDRFEAAPGTGNHMPALGSEMIDPTGDTVLRTWATTP